MVVLQFQPQSYIVTLLIQIWGLYSSAEFSEFCVHYSAFCPPLKSFKCEKTTELHCPTLEDQYVWVSTTVVW